MIEPSHSIETRIIETEMTEDSFYYHLSIFDKMNIGLEQPTNMDSVCIKFIWNRKFSALWWTVRNICLSVSGTESWTHNFIGHCTRSNYVRFKTLPLQQVVVWSVDTTTLLIITHMTLVFWEEKMSIFQWIFFSNLTAIYCYFLLLWSNML